jgi:hypothetical protein
MKPAAHWKQATSEWVDVEQDPTEECYGMIGMVENRLLFMAYTFCCCGGCEHVGNARASPKPSA